MAPRPRSPSPDTNDEEEESALTFFSDSLSSLFNVHSPARGSPGGRLTWSHPRLPPPRSTSTSTSTPASPPPQISYRVPNHTGTSTSLFAHYQWDAGVELCKELCDAQEGSALDVRGMSVCELGAGTGLPSLVCARLGARKVVVTDYPDEGILNTLRENAQGEARQGGGVVVRGLKWGDEVQARQVLDCLSADHQDAKALNANPSAPATPAPTSTAAFDRLIICDTLWVSSSHPLLIASLLHLISHTSPHARVLVSAGFHTGRLCVRRFFELCAGGTGGKLVADGDAPNGGIWEKNVITGEVRPWKGNAGAGEEDGEGMGEIEERARWCVMAILKYAQG